MSRIPPARRESSRGPEPPVRWAAEIKTLLLNVARRGAAEIIWRCIKHIAIAIHLL